jgi:hypothetical protein
MGGAVRTQAQSAAPLNMTVDMGPLEGVELTPANALSYRVLNASGASQEVKITGTIRLRNSPMRLSYSFSTTLEQGVNIFSAERVGRPSWTSTNEALRSLFLNYSRLPQCTYEYCVEVAPRPVTSERIPPDPNAGCTYHTVEDLFAINLIDPEDKAQLYEHYPTFSWTVNYPFASELTYRIRVAEQKSGQNPANAIARNNPMWQDAGVITTTATYPLAGRPLEVGQPYVWTVDAYYHGLLLGGAETWRFILVEDSLFSGVPSVSSYYDFEAHQGEIAVYAIGNIKLKYLNRKANNTLTLEVSESNGITYQTKALPFGENRIDWDVATLALRHRKHYTLVIRDAEGHRFEVPFTYINPDFIK